MLVVSSAIFHPSLVLEPVSWYLSCFSVEFSRKLLDMRGWISYYLNVHWLEIATWIIKNEPKQWMALEVVDDHLCFGHLSEYFSAKFNFWIYEMKVFVEMIITVGDMPPDDAKRTYTCQKPLCVSPTHMLRMPSTWPPRMRWRINVGWRQRWHYQQSVIDLPTGDPTD